MNGSTGAQLSSRASLFLKMRKMRLIYDGIIATEDWNDRQAYKVIHEDYMADSFAMQMGLMLSL